MGYGQAEAASDVGQSQKYLTWMFLCQQGGVNSEQQQIYDQNEKKDHKGNVFALIIRAC